ncbi:MAG: type IV secretion system protein [Erysipelotrichaceae bacterium]|nr:type IV secretion system protein [Erysipelotrichaceae bacterium]
MDPVTLAIIGAVTALAGSIMKGIAGLVSKVAMLELLWYLIGVIPILLFQACITMFVTLMDSSFLVNFNFFPAASSIASTPIIGNIVSFLTELVGKYQNWANMNSGNVTQEIIEHMAPLTATLDAIAGGLFAASMLLAVYKMIFAPLTGDKAMSPAKIIIKIFAVGVLLFTWKSFMGVYFRLFQQIINSLGNSVFSTLQKAANIDLDNTDWAPFVIVREVMSVARKGKFDEGDVMYITQAILITSLSLSMFQCLLSYLERYITFIFYTYVGAPFIALAVNDETSDSFKEWIKGILQQSLGITVSMFFIQIAWKFMLGSTSSDEMRYMFTIMATICFNLSKNSEKLFNMVGFRTMPTGDLARSFMAGVAGLAAQARMAQPIAKAFGNAVGGGFKAVGGAMEQGGKSMMKMGMGDAGLGPIDSDSMQSLGSLSEAEQNVMALDADHQAALSEFNDADKSLGQAESGFRQTEQADNLEAKKDFDSAKAALDNDYGEKMSDINTDYGRLNQISDEYNKGMKDLNEKKGEMSKEEYTAEADKLKQNRNDAMGTLHEELKGKYGDTTSKDAKSVLKNAEQSAKRDYEKGIKDTSNQYEARKNANAQTRQDAVNSYKQQIGYDDKLSAVKESKSNLDSAKAQYEQAKKDNPVASASLLKNSQSVKTGNKFMDSVVNDTIAKKYGKSVEGTDKPVDIAHDSDGNRYVLAQAKVTNERGAVDTKTIAIPMDGAPELRQGSALFDVSGEQIGMGSGYADGTNSYFEYREARSSREDELSSYLMGNDMDDSDDVNNEIKGDNDSNRFDKESKGIDYGEDIDENESGE